MQSDHNDKLINEIIRIMEMKKHERQSWTAIKLMGFLIVGVGVLAGVWYLLTLITN